MSRRNRAPLKATIHKGSHEISGNCIQISSGKTTILLDAGLPLSADSQPVDLSRLFVDALLVSHPHQDHFGLMATLPPGTPVYISRLARSLIDAPQVLLGGDRYPLLAALYARPAGNSPPRPRLLIASTVRCHVYIVSSAFEIRDRLT